jgi:disulfide bond formation protein DsbB
MNLKLYRSARPGSVALPGLAAAAALGVLGGALWMQHQGYAPCPLCILQRMAYLGVLGFALMAMGLIRRGGAVGSNLVLSLGALSALAGLGVAGRHVWLVLHPGQTCGLDPLATVINRWRITQWFPWMFRADGFCADTPKLFGLALPVWSALGFALLATLLFAALRPRARR